MGLQSLHYPVKAWAMPGRKWEKIWGDEGRSSGVDGYCQIGMTGPLLLENILQSHRTEEISQSDSSSTVYWRVECLLDRSGLGLQGQRPGVIGNLEFKPAQNGLVPGNPRCRTLNHSRLECRFKETPPSDKSLSSIQIRTTFLFRPNFAMCHNWLKDHWPSLFNSEDDLSWLWTALLSS